MNKNTNEITEYIKTIFLTIIIAAIVVGIMVLDLRLNVGKKKEQEFHIKELTNIRLSLDELFYLERQKPNDYMINLKIAFLYEILKDSQNAQIHYEKALAKSNDNPFALYKAAMFYASQKEYRDAIGYISLIPEQNNKRYYELKARFYAKLGDYFLEDEDFANSIKVFKMALKYAKNGLDGIIQVKSFGCTPELNAQTVLQNISKDYKIPILHFSFDSQTSETGIKTRLEAFYDMLSAKKK